jgi:two-component system, cell cycle sensor histidine kinase and response regulator CckA
LNAVQDNALRVRPARGDRRDWLWLVVAVGLACAAAVYFAPWLDALGRAVMWLAMDLAAVVMIMVGILVVRPARPAAWAIFAVGIAFLSVGDALWYMPLVQGGERPELSIADAFYLLEYPFLLLGAVALVRGRPTRAMVLDSAMVSLGAAVVIWEFLVRPGLTDSSVPLLGVVVNTAYPIADIAIIGVLTGILFSTGLPSTALRLVAAGFLFTLLADTAYLAITLNGDVPDPSVLDLGWLLALAMWAIAAVHPSARVPVTVRRTTSHLRRIGQMVILVTAAMLVPLTLAARAGEPDPDVPLLVAAWIAMILLVSLRVVGINNDLRRSEGRFRAIIDGSPLGMAIVRGTTLLMTNPAARAMVGGADEEAAIGQSFTRFVAPDSREELLSALGESGGPDRWRPVETVGMRLDGSTFPAIVHAQPITLGDGPAVAGFITDITNERAATETLRASEHRYRQLFEDNPHAMWVYDIESLRFLAVNDLAVERYGWSQEEFLAMTIADIRPPSELSALHENLATMRDEVQSSGPWRHRRKDGSLLQVEVTSHAMVWDGRAARLVLSVDITQRMALEAQLVQAQKMEAVGQLAGGVAHDFNNLLTAMIGNADILRDELPEDGPLATAAAEIIRAGDRAATLTRQLLAFSRRQLLNPRVIDLNAALREDQGMLARLIGEDITIRTRLADDLVSVTVDPIQVTQVLMNLTANARDAMPAGGTLTFETSNVIIDEATASGREGTRPGVHAMLAVTDTGVGIDAETLRHIFEPFFTTKPVGQGTGLGLATVFGIVKQSGGDIRAYSEPGYGTTIRIYLPGAEVQEGAVVRHEPRRSPAAQRTETILLVEDEEIVRALVTRLLERAGYRVLVADNPERADAVAAAEPGRIDLLVSDVIMPGRNGFAFADGMRSARPGIRTLFMSGYTQDAIVDRGAMRPDEAFISKPFETAQFLERVREVLDAEAGVAPGT